MANLVVAQRLAQMREMVQLTQEQLAEQLGCSPSFVSQVERGQSEPSLTRYLQWVHVCGEHYLDPADDANARLRRLGDAVQQMGLREWALSLSRSEWRLVLSRGFDAVELARMYYIEHGEVHPALHVKVEAVTVLKPLRPELLRDFDAHADDPETP
jgi:transcriptional regulator with XRE-family HTH domain